MGNFTDLKWGKAVKSLGFAALVSLAVAGCEAKVLGTAPAGGGATTGMSGPGTGTLGSDGAAGGSCSGQLTIIPTGTGGAVGMGNSGPPVLPATPVTAADPPPPLSGGTLLVLADGHTAVASDPDRDAVWVADLASGTLTASVALSLHDEPGRLVADAAGHVHVVLRRGGALVDLDPATGTILGRRPVCAIPRGVAYDPSRDVVYVACMGGELVTLPAGGGAATQSFMLESDLRDVVVDGSVLYVSVFRRADVLVVDPDSGAVSATITPPTLSGNFTIRNGDAFTPSTAWRMLPARGGGALLLHQRGDSGIIVAGPGGYGSGGPCSSIVHPTMTPIQVGTTCPVTPPLAGATLAIDFAESADGSRTAVISAGSSLSPSMPTLLVADTSDLVSPLDPGFDCGGAPVMLPPVPDGGAGGAGGAGSTTGQLPPATVQPTGEVEAVAFDGSDRVVVQTREPASLQIPEAGLTIALSSVSRADSGFDVFHADSGGGIACASCHAEGQEDGRTWQFDCLGARRTMSISGGIKDRAPYHWGGELVDFPALVNEVYVGRMSGPMLPPDFVTATLNWVDAIPRLPPLAGDPDAVARGQALFDDNVHVGCVLCHTGPHFTSNAIVNVGTGGAFKIPALTGVAWDGPYMHTGCATNLADRFEPDCGGGDNHGVTSTLSANQISDLVTYLQSL